MKLSSKVLSGAATPKPPNAGIGRVKGVPNKITREVRSMILNALDKSGGVNYLVRQATENPTAFLTLLGKCLPKQITGEDSKDLFPTQIKIELVEPTPR